MSWDVATAKVLPAYEPAAGLVTPVIVILTGVPAVRQLANSAPMVTVTTEPATLVPVIEQLPPKPCVKVTVGDAMVNAGLKVIVTGPVPKKKLTAVVAVKPTVQVVFVAPAKYEFPANETAVTLVPET